MLGKILKHGFFNSLGIAVKIFYAKFKRYLNQFLCTINNYWFDFRISFSNLFHSLLKYSFNESGNVFVVICVDTEGPSSFDKNNDWDKINNEVKNVLSKDFRNRYLDDDGNGIKISWFFVDWTNLKENLRGRTLGYHAILNFYLENGFVSLAENKNDDGIYLHYHHPNDDGSYGYNFEWNSRPELENVLCHWIMEKRYFPTNYRAGGTFENNDMSNWLEKWIPFDFSNQSPYKKWNFDWSKAPSIFEIYNPHEYNYKKKGQQKRSMAGSWSIEQDRFDLKKVQYAFHQASQGKDIILSFFTHDYKPLADFIVKGLDMIESVRNRFKYVNIRYCNANEAILNKLKVNRNEEPLSDALLKLKSKDIVSVVIQSDIFQVEPFFVVENKEKKYIRIDSNSCNNGNAWDYLIPTGTIRIGVAYSNYLGESKVLVKDLIEDSK